MNHIYRFIGLNRPREMEAKLRGLHFAVHRTEEGLSRQLGVRKSQSAFEVPLFGF